MDDYSDDGSEVQDSEVQDSEVQDSEVQDSEVECDECQISINCAKEGVFIVSKDEEEMVWCQSCFADMWEDAAKDGWGGDDIETELEKEKEIN